jgi:hypothetical protein
MTEELNSETPTPEVQAEDTTPQSDVVESDDTDWKSEARKWESRAKSNVEAADRWREYESSLKSEDEKRAERLAQVEAELTAERAERTRLEVASEKGIMAEAVKLLTGTTREEIESQADALLKLVADQSSPKSPKPNARQGREVSESISTAESFANAIGSLL